MPERTLKIGGRSVRVLSKDGSDDAVIELDGHRVDVRQRADKKRYTTIAMPYRDYDSLESLVESLVENHPEFRDKQRR